MLAERNHSKSKTLAGGVTQKQSFGVFLSLSFFLLALSFPQLCFAVVGVFIFVLFWGGGVWELVWGGFFLRCVVFGLVF